MKAPSRNELRVYYKIKGKINMALDKDIKAVLKKHGYHFYASGVDMINGIRDMAFDREVEV